ncbi:MAG TPA: hypothetical protein GX746_07030 [Bacteroidales bacterium]|nr:hypothetical protein [Bacteroidales bacterium]
MIRINNWREQLMKHRYIESLLSEIKELESVVESLKQNNKVPFSFFKESFKRTQEISRLLHQLEFVQIEEMRGEMEKLVIYLSEAETARREAEAKAKLLAEEASKKQIISKEEEMQLLSETDTEIDKPKEREEADEVLVAKKEQDSLLEIDDEDERKDKDEEELLPPPLIQKTVDTAKEQKEPVSLLETTRSETILAKIAPKNKSLNDVQPVNQTIQDAMRSISLNDRFLFQRELFDNNREAMTTMLSKLQSFSSLDLAKSYLERNTTWDFRDDTVDKFLQMLKESFR